MNFIKTELNGVYIIEPAVFGDNRGFVMESWSKREFERAGLYYDFCSLPRSRRYGNGRRF